MSDTKCEDIIIVKNNHNNCDNCENKHNNATNDTDNSNVKHSEKESNNKDLIKSLCNDDKVFNDLEEYVLANDEKEIAKKINSLFKNEIKINSNDNNALNEILILSILNVFRKIKKINSSINDYINDMEKSKNNEPEYDTKQLEKIKSFNDFKSSQVLTDHGMELAYCRYILETANIVKSKNRIRLDKNNYKDKLQEIVNEINKFNPLIDTIIEDNEWRINLEDTMNFCVPKNRVVISNSIETHNMDHPVLISHLEKLLRHIENIYDVSDIEYQITEDNKYKMSWVFIIIGYHKIKK